MFVWVLATAAEIFLLPRENDNSIDSGRKIIHVVFMVLLLSTLSYEAYVRDNVLAVYWMILAMITIVTSILVSDSFSIFFDDIAFNTKCSLVVASIIVGVLYVPFQIVNNYFRHRWFQSVRESIIHENNNRIRQNINKIYTLEEHQETPEDEYDEQL